MTRSPETTPALLEVREVCKRFPGVRALHQVCLTLGRGEVLAVIGENGAGKSTLMKILAGVQEPDTGDILLDGSAVTIDSPRRAVDLGVALIHQELNLATNLDVGANIFLGREPLKRCLIDRKTIRVESRRVLEMVGLNVSPDTRLGELPLGQQQLVEIAKALSTNARVLIMDEPTSSLSQGETENLFHVVKQLRESGVSVIYISHRLGEVIELADRVTVLRDGENAGELDRADIHHDNMVRLMVGRDISQFYVRKQHEPGDPALEISELRTAAHPNEAISFTVKAGEIVGMAGLVGAGRTELLRAIFGVEKCLGGSVRVDGRDLSLNCPVAAIEAGLALVPEDRKEAGLVLQSTVRANVSLASLQRDSRRGLVDRAREHERAREMIEKLRIKTPGPEQIAQYLSGGNQQKIVIAKWLAMKPKVLLLDEPTRGIDVGSKQEIYSLMEDLAAHGMAIFYVSSEMEEIIGMADRVLVMHEGRITGQLMRNELTEEAIMHLATGRTRVA